MPLPGCLQHQRDQDRAGLHLDDAGLGILEVFRFQRGCTGGVPQEQLAGSLEGDGGLITPAASGSHRSMPARQNIIGTCSLALL